ncbi:WD40 domain containing protein [Trichuris trichiura]|uniref:WD40 domain containing protein n=1 Tax=Trichuris trichiura TaxID=36087 RepID=A0A077Z232_TRITR|nr:WD40 domain containing protein [Trichuris trichiura]
MKYAFGITAGTSYFTAVSFGKLHDRQCLLAGKKNGELEVRSYRTLRSIVCLKETEDCQVRSCGFFKQGVWAHFRASLIKFWQILPDLTSTVINQIPAPYTGFCAAFVFNSASVGEEVLILPEESNDWAVITVHCFQRQLSYSLKTSGSTVLTKPVESNIFSLLPIEDHSTKFNSLFVLLGTEFGSIQLWDVKKEAIVSETRIHKDIVSELDFSTERSIGVSCSPADGVSVWTIDKGFCIQQTRFLPKQQSVVSHVRIFPGDVDMFIIADRSGTLASLSLTSGEKKDVLSFHRKSVTCLQFAPRNLGGWLLLVCSSDGVISCWQIDAPSTDSLLARGSTTAFISS